MASIEDIRANNKSEILHYLFNRSKEIIAALEGEHGSKNFKKISLAFQPLIKQSRDALCSNVIQTAQREGWPAEDRLKAILLVHHATNAAMIEFRNGLWPYEYMAFSRRNGELWGAFCKLPFDFPVREELRLEVPPLFADVRASLADEIAEYIDGLPLDGAQKEDLKAYYLKVWLLVDSGEIKLELDLHFALNRGHFNVDFKSGFGSNEKGNTNRLLIVGSIYKNLIAEEYTNLILVRAPEDRNNHYLQTLKNSLIWEVRCGDESYDRIGELCGFGLREWINSNIDWSEDLSSETVEYLTANDLMGYLEW